MSLQPHRVTFIMTHPVQYLTPWFRWMHANVADIQLTVLYAVQPTSEAQAAGFGGAFEWDGALLDGYSSHVLTPGRSPTPIGADAYSRVDAANLEDVLIDSRPDAVVVPGWHAAVYRHAIRVCRRRGIPLIYRGDSQLASGPSGPARPVWRMVTRRRLAGYSAYLAVGTRSRQYLRALDAPEPMIFDSPHCVDNDAIERRTCAVSRGDAHRHFRLEPGRFTVLFAGKLQKKKRPVQAVRAVARLRDAQLLIAGSGPLESACREASTAHGGSVVFAGFLNQDEMPLAFAAADCVVLPSDGGETWGLVVNEAMAAGLPAVVSDAVGCGANLVQEGVTGAVARLDDEDDLTAALERVGAAIASGHSFVQACRTAARRHSFSAASDGLVAACARLRHRARNQVSNAAAATQVVACCGHMVVAGGLERMTFEVLGTLHHSGAGVHALVNRWGSSRIVRLGEHAGVECIPYRSDEPLRWRPSWSAACRMGLEIVRSSVDVFAAARRFRATHILAPDFLVTVRNWPALLLLRASGCRIVLRVGMAPAEGKKYRRLWRWVVNPVVDRVVCNSAFLLNAVRAHGIPPAKLGLVRNTVASRSTRSAGLAAAGRVLYVGQLIPGKGVDLLLEAIALLRGEGLDVSLDVVGEFEGWESPTYRGHRQSLVARATQNDLQHAVRFLGLREDVPALMRESSVHCLSSRTELREGMAGVVLEAKSAGIPSVVTQSGSLPELVTHRVDGWIATDDAASIAAGLRYFLADEQRRTAAGQAARLSLERFDRETFENGWRHEFALSSTTLASLEAPALAIGAADAHR